MNLLGISKMKFKVFLKMFILMRNFYKLKLIDIFLLMKMKIMFFMKIRNDNLNLKKKFNKLLNAS